MRSWFARSSPTPAPPDRATDAWARPVPPGEVFLAFLKLGLTSFGGPIAHLGYFRNELVVRRKWIEEAAYGDVVALCQFLPGPASSQVGFSLGVLTLFRPRARPAGGPPYLGVAGSWS
jgi:chromate transporter